MTGAQRTRVEIDVDASISDISHEVHRELVGRLSAGTRDMLLDHRADHVAIVSALEKAVARGLRRGIELHAQALTARGLLDVETAVDPGAEPADMFADLVAQEPRS